MTACNFLKTRIPDAEEFIGGNAIKRNFSDRNDSTIAVWKVPPQSMSSTFADINEDRYIFILLL